MTIENQYATCDPVAAGEHVGTWVHVDGPTYDIALRPHERLIDVRELPHNARTPTGVQVVSARTCWDHRITSDWSRGGPGTWELGEDSFWTNRHADGTFCGTEETYHGGERVIAQRARCICVIFDVPCTVCGAINSHVVEQQAYGDLTTCTTEGCTYSVYYSIGD